MYLTRVPKLSFWVPVTYINTSKPEGVGLKGIWEFPKIGGIFVGGSL